MRTFQHEYLHILEKQKLQEDLAQLLEQQRSMEQTIARFLELEGHLSTCIGDETLDERLIDELIERIEVSASGNLEIRFSCNDIYSSVLEMTEESST